MKKQTWKMHFYKGVPCRWDGESYDKECDNYEFEADLFIAGYERGCSSAVILLVHYADRNKDRDEITHYAVFMSDITSIVRHMTHGRIKGTFVWVKKGANYGIQLKEKDE